MCDLRSRIEEEEFNTELFVFKQYEFSLYITYMHGLPIYYLLLLDENISIKYISTYACL